MPLHEIQTRLIRLFKNDPEAYHRSLRNLAIAIDIPNSSPQKIRHHLMQLEKKGLIRYSESQGLSVLSDPIEDVVELNLYAQASCGNQGLYYQGEILDKIPVSTKLFNINDKNKYFLVKAFGNSMEPEINDGDIILVRQQGDLYGNSIYLCLHDGLPKLKRVIRSKDGYTLKSSNMDYPDVNVIPGEDFSISGILIANLRIF